MLREIAIEEEMPGDFQTTFRLRVDGDVIAESMTELETQFLVSEMLDRIPSLRSPRGTDTEQPCSDSAALPLGESSERGSQAGSLYAQALPALCESPSGTHRWMRDTLARPLL